MPLAQTMDVVTVDLSSLLPAALSAQTEEQYRLVELAAGKLLLFHFQRNATTARYTAIHSFDSGDTWVSTRPTHTYLNANQAFYVTPVFTYGGRPYVMVPENGNVDNPFEYADLPNDAISQGPAVGVGQGTWYRRLANGTLTAAAPIDFLTHFWEATSGDSGEYVVIRQSAGWRVARIHSYANQQLRYPSGVPDPNARISSGGTMVALEFDKAEWTHQGDGSLATTYDKVIYPGVFFGRHDGDQNSAPWAVAGWSDDNIADTIVNLLACGPTIGVLSVAVDSQHRFVVAKQAYNQASNVKSTSGVIASDFGSDDWHRGAMAYNGRLALLVGKGGLVLFDPASTAAQADRFTNLIAYPDAATAKVDKFAMVKYPSGNDFYFATTDRKFHRGSPVEPPEAPALVAPDANTQGYHNAATAVNLAWTYNGGGTQTRWRIRRTVHTSLASTTTYLTVTDGWASSAGASTEITGGGDSDIVPVGWGAVGERVEFAVQTGNSAGWSPWSNVVEIRGADAPTLTSWTVGGSAAAKPTLTTTPVVVDWVAPNQDGYEITLRTVAKAGETPTTLRTWRDDNDASTRSFSIEWAWGDGTYEFEIKVLFVGLETAPQTRQFVLLASNAPADPGVTITVVNADGSEYAGTDKRGYGLKIDAEHTSSSIVPVWTSGTLLRGVKPDDANLPVEYGEVLAEVTPMVSSEDPTRQTASIIDWTVVSGVLYAYRFVMVGVNGQIKLSPWVE